MGELRQRRRVALPVLAGIGGMVVPVADLPGLQRRVVDSPRLGDGDVDRHRVRPGTAGAGRAALPRPPACLSTHRGDRRRRHRADRDRARVQRQHRRRPAARRTGGARPDPGDALRRGPFRPALRPARSRGLVGGSRAPESTRSWSGWCWVCWCTRRLPRAATWSAPPTCSARSASSPPRSWRAPPSRAFARPSLPTCACRGCSTRGRATCSCRCSPWRTPGIEINGDFLSRAFTSTITLGILIGYVVGKPIGIAGTRGWSPVCSRGRLRPPVGWAAVVGGGAIAGIGFTVSILIATLAFSGDRAGGGQAGRAQRRGVCPRCARGCCFA